MLLAQAHCFRGGVAAISIGVLHAVSEICKKHGVKHLSLFGSFAKGTNQARSDIDFIVFGCKDYMALKEEIDEIPTLRKVDLFVYDEVCSEHLKEDMDQYGVPLY